jgi:hypothetical protein
MPRNNIDHQIHNNKNMLQTDAAGLCWTAAATQQAAKVCHLQCRHFKQLDVPMLMMQQAFSTKKQKPCGCHAVKPYQQHCLLALAVESARHGDTSYKNTAYNRLHPHDHMLCCAAFGTLSHTSYP